MSINISSKYNSIEIVQVVVIVIIVAVFSSASHWRNRLFCDEAALWLDSTSKSPKKSRPFNSLGVAYANSGLYDDAIASFKIAVKNGSGIREVHHFNLGRVYLDKGMVAEALLEFQEAVKIKPFYAEAHFQMGHIYRHVGALEKAELELSTAVQQAPDNPGYCNDLGNIFLLKKKYGLAVQEYVKSLEMNPQNVETFYNLGLSYDGLNMAREASAYYEAFIKKATPEYSTSIEYARQRIISLMGN